jgi:hypothetical protein
MRVHQLERLAASEEDSILVRGHRTTANTFTRSPVNALDTPAIHAYMLRKLASRPTDRAAYALQLQRLRGNLYMQRVAALGAEEWGTEAPMRAACACGGGQLDSDEAGSNRTGLVSAAPATGVQRKCEKCEEEEKRRAGRLEQSAGTSSGDPEREDDVKAPGAPQNHVDRGEVLGYMANFIRREAPVRSPGLLRGSSSETRFFENIVPDPKKGLAISAEMTIHRPSATTRAAYLTTGDVAEDEDADVIKMGQFDGVDGGDSTSAVPLAGGGCSYSITYANQQSLGCSGGRCGAQIRYDVTAVNATGDGCPPTLTGYRVTEDVTTDNGCGPGSVTTGAGCPIQPDGTVLHCRDTYALCLPPGSVPAGGCTEVYTQRLWVTPPGTSGGTLAETRTITFSLTNAGGACSGTVTRT